MHQLLRLGSIVHHRRAHQQRIAHAGITSENVAEKFGITREQQDKLAARSHNRAAAATKAGKFKAEIVPVHTTWKDPKTGEEKQITVTADDGFREGATAGGLAKLPAVFKKGGSTTAANSSQVWGT